MADAVFFMILPRAAEMSAADPTLSGVRTGRVPRKGHFDGETRMARTGQSAEQAATRGLRHGGGAG